MSNNFGVVFGGILAAVLLGIFCFSTLYLVYQIFSSCGMTASCNDSTITQPEGFRHVFTTIGGLISALVIAQLSVTKPGEAPTVGNFKAETEAGQATTTKVVSLYMAIWMLCGVLALVFGVIIYNKVDTMLSDFGTGWLGMAVSAAYAYFGINPPKK